MKNPHREIFSSQGFTNPHRDFDLCRGIFSRSLQIESQKPIEFSPVGSILLEISHFRFLCQLKVLGHFAKNQSGKKNPVAVHPSLRGKVMAGTKNGHGHVFCKFCLT